MVVYFVLSYRSTVKITEKYEQLKYILNTRARVHTNYTNTHNMSVHTSNVIYF